MKIKAALMLFTALVMPSAADALPVVSFFSGIAAGVGGATAGWWLGTGAYALGVKVATSVLGTLLLNVGLSYLLTPKGPKAPTIEAAQVNTRLADASRWQIGGRALVGGEAGIFAEYDELGNFWCIVAHGDAEMVGPPQYYLDGVSVTLSDGTDGFALGDVITDEFCSKTDYTEYEGTGTKQTHFRLYTVTPSVGNVYGPVPADLIAAFPDLPADFLLAGVCYTVMRGATVPLQHYSKVYRWRGPYGLGEPAVTVVANFNRMYDPREIAHDLNDPDTWTASDGNPAIVAAWFRTAPYGRARPVSEINWDLVAEKADICDQTVLDRSGDPIPRYRCGVAFPDNKPRHECEGEILLTCDGFSAYDDDGRWYPNVGVYEAPDLTFSASRDILSAQTQIVDDGEAAVDGVVVSYISPDHGYTKQPAAPWRNTAYYDGSSEPNYLTLDVLGCQNHNQAVRLAKAIGLRSAATKRASIQTTIKGILAKNRRTIDLDYDANFTGDFEIVTPVQEDPNGMACSFAIVPMQTDRYDLGVGEEGEPPIITPPLNIDKTLEVAQNVVLAVEVLGNGSPRLNASFDAPVRQDRTFRFRYANAGEMTYQYFTVDMDELEAYSAIVDIGQIYDVQWQTVTSGGRATEWSAIEQITATAPATGLAAPTPLGASVAASVVTATFVAPNDENYRAANFFVSYADDFAQARKIAGPLYGAASAALSVVELVGMLPHDFRDGDARWTGAASGAPGVVAAPAASITYPTVAGVGPVARFTDVSGATAIPIGPRDVAVPAASRTYRLTARARIIGATTLGTDQVQLAIQPLDATYAALTQSLTVVSFPTDAWTEVSRTWASGGSPPEFIRPRFLKRGTWSDPTAQIELSWLLLEDLTDGTTVYFFATSLNLFASSSGPSASLTATTAPI